MEKKYVNDWAEERNCICIDRKKLVTISWGCTHTHACMHTHKWFTWIIHEDIIDDWKKVNVVLTTFIISSSAYFFPEWLVNLLVWEFIRFNGNFSILFVGNCCAWMWSLPYGICVTGTEHKCALIWLGKISNSVFSESSMIMMFLKI